MKKILVVLALLATTVAVIGQSSPGLQYGQVPTAAQWNSYFAAKQDVLGYTPVNRAGDRMTGPLVTAASVPLAAGFNMQPGTAPSSPLNGDMWMTSAGLFARVSGSSIGPFVTNQNSIYASPTPPTSPVIYQLWINTTSNPAILNQYDGSQWLAIGTTNTSTHVWSPRGTWSGAIIGQAYGGLGIDISGATGALQVNAGTVTAATLPVSKGGTGATTVTGLVLGNGTSAMSAYAGTSCTNQFPRSLSALGAATCATVANTDLANSSITINGTAVSLGGTRTLTLASSDFANQGTTTTVLHGNAAGNPSWSAISISDLGSIAANTVVANATGSSAAPTALAMPSCTGGGVTIQWISGTGFTCNTSINAATASNLSGGSSGQLPWQSGVNSTSMLAAGSSGQILHSGGTGAPTWAAVDLSGTQVTSTLPVARGGTGAVTITGLVLGNGTSAMSAYAGATCTNQFVRSLSAAGAATCASVSLSTDVTGSLALSNLASQAANTIVGATALGAPTALAIPNCSSGSSSALNWGAGTGFSCNTSIAANTASVASSINGGAAGQVPYQSASSTTAFVAVGSAGQVLQSNGSSAPTWTTATFPATAGTNLNVLQSNGTNWVSAALTSASINAFSTNTAASAGHIGYRVTLDVAYTVVPVTSGAPLNIGSVSLEAGNWACSANVAYNPTVSTVISTVAGWISTSSASAPVPPGGGIFKQLFPASFAPNDTIVNGTATVMFSFASTTTVYLSAVAYFSTSTLTAGGHMECWHPS